MRVRNIGQQQALPRCHAQAAIAPFAGQLRGAAQHVRSQTPQRGGATDGAQASLLLWINTQITVADGCRPAPVQNRCITSDAQP
ncbi:hypothetical protein D3C72_1619170 [compost metagenome]